MPKPKTPPKLPGRNRAGSARPRTSAARAAFADLAEGGRLRTVPVDRVAPNPRQPRRRFDDDQLQGLVDSIAERGVLQPPVVRAVGSGYELVAGERRWRAAQRAGLTTLDVLVAECNDATALQDAVMENVVRQDLTPIEAARAYRTIIEDLGITREALGRRIGLSRVSISNHLRLLDLPEPALELIDAGALTFAHGRVLLLCDDAHARTALARRAADEGWSTRKRLGAPARHAPDAPRAPPPSPMRSPAATPTPSAARPDWSCALVSAREARSPSSRATRRRHANWRTSSESMRTPSTSPRCRTEEPREPPVCCFAGCVRRG